MNFIPWLLAAAFALLWWRKGEAGPPDPSQLPPPRALLPTPPTEPEDAVATRTASPLVPAPPLVSPPLPPQVTIIETAPAVHIQQAVAPAPVQHDELADHEAGKAHLRGRQNWILAGGGLLAVALAGILISAAYNRLPVVPDATQQNRLGIAPDGPASITALAGADARRAPALFRSYGCVSCHVIPGVSGATGRVGPNLGHLYDHALIAGVIANTPDNLVAWIREPRTIDPRTGMPNLGVTEQDARDIAAYLQTLQ